MNNIKQLDSIASDRILQSARKHIAEKGILGLRVADVAESAYSSVTQIYRYFGSREGLLARVLGDIYEEQLEATVAGVLSILAAKPSLTLDDVVDALPSPTDERLQASSEIRLQILAVSVNNEQLFERLTIVSQQHLEKWNQNIAVVLARLPEEERFDPRSFTMNLVLQMTYYRKLLGPAGFSESEYRDYVRDLLRALPAK